MGFILMLEVPFQVINADLPKEALREGHGRASLLPGTYEMEFIENPINPIDPRFDQWAVVKGTKLGMSDKAMTSRMLPHAIINLIEMQAVV